MNVYTVAKASQGLADYVNEKFSEEQRSIAVSYDSRIHSKDFAETAAQVFAANGIQVYIYDELMPTPCLSFAVRELGCAAGVMVTASHNPGEYNGYKVYGADGCQITTEAAKEISLHRYLRFLWKKQKTIIRSTIFRRRSMKNFYNVYKNSLY